MKKYFFIILMAACLILPQSVFADNDDDDGHRLGVQFSSAGDLGVIYYGDDYGWAAGGSVGFLNDDSEYDGNDIPELGLSALSYGVFIRKNFELMEKTYLGLGVSTEWTNTSGPFNIGGTSFSGDVDSWRIAPYFIVDYHLNRHFVLNAGALIVSFTDYDYEADGVSEEISEKLDRDTVEYFEPFLSLTYLF